MHEENWNHKSNCSYVSCVTNSLQKQGGWGRKICKFGQLYCKNIFGGDWLKRVCIEHALFCMSEWHGTYVVVQVMEYKKAMVALFERVNY